MVNKKLFKNLTNNIKNYIKNLTFCGVFLFISNNLPIFDLWKRVNTKSTVTWTEYLLTSTKVTLN